MDYTLCIIIPKREVEIVKIKEKLVRWENSVYSYEPPQYVTDSDIAFEQIEDIQCFNTIIGEELTYDSIVLHLKSDMLFDLEYAINSDEEQLRRNK